MHITLHCESRSALEKKKQSAIINITETSNTSNIFRHLTPPLCLYLMNSICQIASPVHLRANLRWDKSHLRLLWDNKDISLSFNITKGRKLSWEMHGLILKEATTKNIKEYSVLMYQASKLQNRCSWKLVYINIKYFTSYVSLTPCNPHQFDNAWLCHFHLNQVVKFHFLPFKPELLLF